MTFLGKRQFMVFVMDKRKQLKISFLLPNRGLGGGVRAIAIFGNELLLRGHDVRVFYREDQGGFTQKGKNIYRRLRYGVPYDWLDTFNGQSFRYDHLDHEQFARYELIVSMCARTTLDASALPEEVGIKVLHCHGAEIENWEAMVESWRLPFPKLVVSSHLEDMIQKEVGQQVIGVVPNGVNTSDYFPSLPNKRRNGIGAGFRWSLSKDPAATLRVFKELHEKLPQTPLYSYGHGRRPRELKHVNYMNNPTVPEARRIYSSCRVWFMTSILEGFGLPVSEAMACGCPVVSTKCGGPQDVIEDGINGFLVGVGNTGALVHKILTIYNDKQLWKRLSLNAIETARKFTWQGAAAKLEQYLFSIHEKVKNLAI